MTLATRWMVPLLAVAVAVAVASPADVQADQGGAAAARAGYIGVGLEPGRGGLVVSSVEPDSPGAGAGLQPGDVILRARGGPPGDAETFSRSVRAAGAGTTYPLVVRRRGQQLDINVRLAAMPQRGVSVGAPVPALAAQLVMGSGPSNLAQLRGRVVILDFWASWCGPCRAVMPALNGFHQRYAAQGLTVLGVTDEGAAIARAVGGSMSIQYTLATDPAAAVRFGVTGLPTMVVIDRAGTVRRVSVGISGPEIQQLDGLVQRLLAEPQRP